MKEMTQAALDEEEREARGGAALVGCLVVLCTLLIGFGLGIILPALLQHLMGG